MFLVANQTRFLVSSVVLSLASKGFATMFSSRFLEGQQLSSEDPPIIEFPEDGLEAFELLLEILHSRNVNEFTNDDFDDRTVHEDTVVSLLVLADKYDCVTAVRPQASLWTREVAARMEWTCRIGSFDEDQEAVFDKLLAGIIVGFVAQDVEVFWKASRGLILYTGAKESFTRAGYGTGAHLIPSALWSEDTH